MTNHWSDIGNSSLVLAWGANPSENHPACMAHIGRARANQNITNSDGTKGAKLVVVDPRKTRTAVLADQYIRIRPGTDIALLNGITREIISQMEGTSPNGSVAAGVVTKFFAFLNQTGNGTFFTDGTSTTASGSATPVPGNSKYTDARFLVKADGTDYVRDRVLASTGEVTTAGPDSTTISNFPLKAADCRTDENTVYNRLKAHVDPYTLAVTSGIAGCSQKEILDLVKYFVENSRCSSIADPVGAPARSHSETTLTPRSSSERRCE